MTIGTKIIKRALRKIQVDTLNSPASPEDIEGAVPVLNEMLALWTSKNIELGIIPLESAGNELGEPPDTTLAIVSNLAIYLADDFEDGEAVVTITLKDNARRTFEDLASLGYRTLNIPGKVPSSTLLTGEGNKGWWNSYRTFFGPNTTLGGEEGALGFSSGIGGGGGGIPGPPGPPGPEGPQGPPGDEVFATLAETIAGVVNNKSIAPDTAHGLLASPPSIGNVQEVPDIFVSGMKIGIASAAVIQAKGTNNLTVETNGGNLFISSLNAGTFVEVNALGWPSAKNVTYVVGQVPQVSATFPGNFAEIAFEAPHEILNIFNGGDMVYNTPGDTLTALPIGSENEFIGTDGNIPIWKQLPSSAHRNFIIDGDFAMTFAGTSGAQDNVYVTPLWRFLSGDSNANILIERNTTAADLPFADTFGHHVDAALQLEVIGSPTSDPNSARTTLKYTITGTDFTPLPRKNITFYFVGRTNRLKGPFSVALQNGDASRTKVQTFSFTKAGTTQSDYELIALNFTLDEESGVGPPAFKWDFTDDKVGMSIYVSFSGGANFQTINLNVWNGDNLTISDTQAQLDQTAGDTIDMTLIGFNEGTNTQYLSQNIQTVKDRFSWYRRLWTLNSSASEESGITGLATANKEFRMIVPFGRDLRIAPPAGPPPRVVISNAIGWDVANDSAVVPVDTFSPAASIGKNGCIIEGEVQTTPFTDGEFLHFRRRGAAADVTLSVDARHYD